MKNKSNTDLVPLGYKQPDSVFFSVLYDNGFAVRYFSVKRTYPGDFEFSSVEQYSFVFTDSNYIIRKLPFCNTQYKEKFESMKLQSTGVSQQWNGISCLKYFSVDRYNDTTVYYINNQLPRSAGIKVYENVSGCIVGFENKFHKVVPVKLDMNATYKVTGYTIEKNIPLIASTGKLWIDSPFSDIIKGQSFPPFFATDTKDRSLTEKVFDENGEPTIVVVMNYIRFCSDYDKMLAPYYAGADEASSEIIDALNKLAMEKKKKYLVMTADLFEKISDLNYDNLHIIPNAAAWREKLKIFQMPLILKVDSSGTIVRFGSTFDFGNTESYYEGFKSFLSSN